METVSIVLVVLLLLAGGRGNLVGTPRPRDHQTVAAGYEISQGIGYPMVERRKRI
jgi:hypothetical protein